MSDIIEKIIKRSPFDTEINLSSRKDIEIEYERFPITSHTESANLEIRITKGKRYGYSSTSDLKNWKKCLTDASKIMKISKPLDIEPELAKKQKYREKKPNKKLWSMESEEVISLFKNMSTSKTKIKYSNIAKSISHGVIANSNGVFHSSDSVVISAGVQVSLGGASSFGVKISDKPFDTQKVAEEAERFCLMAMKPKKVKTMITDAIFDYFAISSLIEAVLVPAFFSDRVQSGSSFLCDKIGQKLFSEELNIVDDGTKGLFSVPCDNEGVATQKKVLIDKGIPRTFLYDSYSAQKDGRSSTGNCSSISKRPSIGPTNIIIKPGKSMILDYESDHLVVRSLTGVHTSNPVSGDFSVTLDDAFYKGKSVKHAMIAGNVFQLLNSIESVGKISRQDGVVKTPPIKFRDLQVVA
jgi:PmbA protein